jgi:hypothetical protein
VFASIHALAILRDELCIIDPGLIDLTGVGELGVEVEVDLVIVDADAILVVVNTAVFGLAESNGYLAIERGARSDYHKQQYCES